MYSIKYIVKTIFNLLKRMWNLVCLPKLYVVVQSIHVHCACWWARRIMVDLEGKFATSQCVPPTPTIWPCPWVDIGLGQYLSACSLNCSVYLTSGLWFHVFLFLPYPFLSHLHNQDWTWNVVLFYLLAFFMYCFSVIWTLLYCFSLWESN